VLRRRSPKRVAVSNVDRLVLVGLYRLAPEVLDALKILQPETGRDGPDRGLSPIQTLGIVVMDFRFVFIAFRQIFEDG
jgi:hypothetical protein